MGGLRTIIGILNQFKNEKTMISTKFVLLECRY